MTFRRCACDYVTHSAFWQFSLRVGNNRVSRCADRFAGKFDHAYRRIGSQSDRFYGDGAHDVSNGNHSAALQGCQSTQHNAVVGQQDHVPFLIIHSRLIFLLLRYPKPDFSLSPAGDRSAEAGRYLQGILHGDGIRPFSQMCASPDID